MDTNVDAVVQAALAAANNAAAADAPGAGAVTTQAPAANTAVGAPVSPQGPKSLEDVAASSAMSVDGYIKTKYEGIFLGDDKTALDELKVRIRGSEIALYSSVSFGDPVKYGRSYNGTTEAFTGKPWGQFVADAMRMDGRCKGAYDAADIPMYLAEPFTSQREPNKGKVVFDAGSCLGYTTSRSAMREFRTFVKKVILPLGQDEIIEGVVKLKALKNEKGEWGVLDFGSPADWKVVIEDE